MKKSAYVHRTALLCVLLMAAGIPIFSQQIEKSIVSSTGDQLGFLEYKPVNYDKDLTTKHPLIIFLHGIGERGNGGTELKNVSCCGIPRMIKLGHNMQFTWNGKTETFLTLSPQCPSKYSMWPAVFIEELISYAKKNLRIDPERIFLTGLSMGGGGTYRFISTSELNPTSITAAATICAPCTFSNGKYVAEAKLPVWSFHASDDPTASVACTDAAISKINAAHPQVTPIKTIWPTGGHIVWDRVYTDTSYAYQGVLNIYEWFLGQNKNLPPNILPVANAGSDSRTDTQKGTVVLDGAGSADADGNLVRFVWKKISGPSAGKITRAFGESAATTVTGLSLPGVYSYELAVVDNRAGFTLDTVTVTVTPAIAAAPIPNKVPVARAGADTTITLPLDSLALNGAASSDQDGSIKSYVWSQVSGPACLLVRSQEARPIVGNLNAGKYIFRLVVTDNSNASASDSIEVTVLKRKLEEIVEALLPDTVKKPVNDSINKPVIVNRPPVANAGIDNTIKLSYRDRALLNATLSTDSDGWIKTFYWQKISGPLSGPIQNPSAGSTFIDSLTPGIYVFRVTVTDNKGLSASDDVVVTARGAGSNKSLFANAGADKIIVLSYANKCLLNGTLSKEFEGWITAYDWKKLSGPAAGNIESRTIGAAWANSLIQGTYIFRLTVKNNRGDSAYDDVKIIVNASNKTTMGTMAVFTSNSGIDAMTAGESAALYPNPAVNSVKLKYSSNAMGLSVVSIFDISGKLIKNIQFEKNQTVQTQPLDVSSLEKGIYYVEVKTGDKARMVVKLTK